MRPQGGSGLFAFAASVLVATGLVMAGGAGCKGTAESCAEQIRIKYQTKGWLGIEIEQGEDGTITIAKVYPGSPAEVAGIQVGDQLVSMDGVAYTPANRDELKAIKNEKAKIGATMSYELKRGSTIFTAHATLARIPDPILTATIERHTREQHASTQR